MSSLIRIQTQDFDVGFEQQRLRDQSRQVGAIVCFSGLVREYSDAADVVYLELEHYPGMTESAINDIVELASARWQLNATTVIHRVGRLLASDQIVLVAVSSEHRANAFAAAEFIMDKLKSDVPIWKKQCGPDGEHWLETKQSDREALARWDLN